MYVTIKKDLIIAETYAGTSLEKNCRLNWGQGKFRGRRVYVVKRPDLLSERYFYLAYPSKKDAEMDNIL